MIYLFIFRERREREQAQVGGAEGEGEFHSDPVLRCPELWFFWATDVLSPGC